MTPRVTAQSPHQDEGQIQRISIVRQTEKYYNVSTHGFWPIEMSPRKGIYFVLYVDRHSHHEQKDLNSKKGMVYHYSSQEHRFF